ncbi:ATP-binding protein [Saccharothrix sp. BKS2]|uniref:AAA family ATPase n=1 Tax=Saccharothrix sp. BKS2 TaxID=3064400 RepID=UPI0039EBD205
MSRTHEDPGWEGPAPEPGHGGVSYHVEVGGGTDGPVVAGSYNLVVDARHGSSVTVGLERQRPAPVRRDRIAVVPRRTREPVGREADAATLSAAIAAGGVVQLCGPAGIGKSALLRHLARTAGNGPDGVVFVSAAHRQVSDLAQQVFESCYRTWGYAPSRTDLRALLAGLRITVYVDDADLTADQLREFTDLVPDATFVLARRDSTPLGDGPVHHLDGLGQDAAALLLTRALGRPLHDAEHATAASLWQVSGGNPLLLLRVAGVAGSGRSALPAPGAVEDLLPRLLDRLDRLGGSAMSAVNLLAVLEDAELAPEHIGALTGEPDPAALCERLAGLGLVTPGEHGYRCAPGVVPAVRRDTAAHPVEGLCRYFTRWAGDPATTPARVAEHSRAIERVAGLATAAGMPELTVALGRAASPKLAHSLRFDAWGRALGRGWTGARRAGDREAEAYFTHEEGVRCLVTGRLAAAAALLAQAALLWHVLGDGRGTTAASEAHQFLPRELQSPGRVTAPEQPAPAEGDTSQAVADHMADLDRGVPGSPPTSGEVGSGYSGAEVTDFGVPAGPGPTQTYHGSPGGGDVGATTATSTATTAAATSAIPVGAATTGATAATGAAAAAQGGSALATLLVGLVVVGVVAVTAYNENEEIPTASGAAGSGIVGTWEFDQKSFTIEESGPGAYSFSTTCGDDITLTGDDTEATGEMPARTRDSAGGPCGPIIGYNTATITAGPSPDTAWWTVTMPPEEAEIRTCVSCGMSVMTRVG